MIYKPQWILSQVSGETSFFPHGFKSDKNQCIKKKKINASRPLKVKVIEVNWQEFGYKIFQHCSLSSEMHRKKVLLFRSFQLVVMIPHRLKQLCLVIVCKLNFNKFHQVTHPKLRKFKAKDPRIKLSKQAFRVLNLGGLNAIIIHRVCRLLICSMRE